MSSPSIFASAIGQAEGYGVPGAIPTLANNPGDLKLGDVGSGTMGSGITVFGSAEEGWAALENQLSKITGGSSAYYGPQMTISQMGQVWAGGDPNWANNVSQALGTNPSAAIGNYLPGGQNESGQAAIPSLPGWDYNALPGQSTQGEAQGAGGAVGTGTSGAGDSSMWGRIAAGLVGLICIGGGVMMFRQSQVIIQNVAGAAKKAAALAAALFLVLALGSSSAAGQNTTNVTATLTDSDGQAWINCSWGADLFNPSGGQQPIYTNTGQPVPVHITGQTCDGTGSLSYAIPDNNKITPIGTRWVFTLQSNTSAPPTVTNNVLVTGASMNLTANLSGQLVVPRFNPGSEKRGYLDVEVLNPIQGSQYYNVVSLGSRQYNGTAWSGIGGTLTASQVATPMVAAANNSPPCEFQGDSIIAGSGPTNSAGLVDPALAWVNLTRPYTGMFCTNKAAGGSSSIDVNNNMVMATNIQPSPGQVYLMDAGGTNDTQQGGNGANYLLVAQRAMQNDVWWNVTPQSSKNLLQSATMAGGFAVSSTYRAGQGIKSTTNGATASQAITVNATGVIEFCHMVYNGNTGTFTVKVDGNPQTDPVSGSATWISGGDGGQAINTAVYATTQFCAGDRLTGFAPGSHTVLFTQTGAGTVDIEALWSPGATGNALVFMMDVPQLGASVSPNAPYTALYQTIITNALTTAQTDTASANPYIIAARALMGANPGPNFSSDQTHPSTLGSQTILGTVTTPTTALYALNAAGLVTNSPYLMSGHTAQYNSFGTIDTAHGFTLNSSNFIQAGNPSLMGGLQSFNYGKGSSAWSFDGPAPGGSFHVFGHYGPTGFADCSWATPAGQANTTITVGSPTSCSWTTGSVAGQTNLGVDTSGHAAVITQTNALSIGFANGNVQGNYYANNGNFGLTFLPQNAATSSTNFGGAFLGFMANIWNSGSSIASNFVYKFSMSVGTGTSGGTTLGITTGSTTGGGVTPAFRNIDLTASSSPLPITKVILPVIAASATGTAILSTSNCAFSGQSSGASAPPGGTTAGSFFTGVSGACTVVITSGTTGPLGHVCFATDMTTPTNVLRMSAETTTTCTITGTVTSSDAVFWTDTAY